MDFAQNDEMPVLGTIEQLESIIKDHEISKILCTLKNLLILACTESSAIYVTQESR